MRNVIEKPSTQNNRPIELRHLRVAAYCRVSTDLEEQTSSIELQERYYTQRICMNPNWERGSSQSGSGKSEIFLYFFHISAHIWGMILWIILRITFIWFRII